MLALLLAGAIVSALVPTATLAYTVFPTLPPSLTPGKVSRASTTTAEVNFYSNQHYPGVYYYQIDGVAPVDVNALAITGTADNLSFGINSLILKNITAEAHIVYIAAGNYATNAINLGNLLVVHIPPVYTITVAGGTVQEDMAINAYTEWTHLQITANQPPDGYVFDKWTTDGDYINNFANLTNSITTFVMPAKDVAITANWKLSTSTANTIITADTTPATLPTTQGGDDINDSHINWGLWIACPLFVAGTAALVYLLRTRKK